MLWIWEHPQQSPLGSLCPQGRSGGQSCFMGVDSTKYVCDADSAHLIHENCEEGWPCNYLFQEAWNPQAHIIVVGVIFLNSGCK